MLNLDFCSYFIDEKALFGSFPTQEKVKQLEDLGVILFVDLTHPNESKINKYSTSRKYKNFPIIDFGVPNDHLLFSKFILETCKAIGSLQNNEKIYVHCRGGHGRSGIVVSSILAQHFNLSSECAISRCNSAHSERKTMREKWRVMGSPQTGKQKTFIEKYFAALDIDEIESFSLIRANSLLEPTDEQREMFEQVLKQTCLKRLVSANNRTITSLLTEYRINLLLK